MRRKSFGNMQCPIARGLERVGEWWSILILRDAFYGLTRFDEFQKSLGIAPNMLTRRLDALVEAGLLERRRYSERPPRDEYLLTERGRDFRPVLLAFMAWGNRHLAPEGASVRLVDAATGLPADPVLVDREHRPAARRAGLRRGRRARRERAHARADGAGAGRRSPRRRKRRERHGPRATRGAAGAGGRPRPHLPACAGSWPRRASRSCWAPAPGTATAGGRWAASSTAPTTPSSAATSWRVAPARRRASSPASRWPTTRPSAPATCWCSSTTATTARRWPAPRARWRPPRRRSPTSTPPGACRRRWSTRRAPGSPRPRPRASAPGPTPSATARWRGAATPRPSGSSRPTPTTGRRRPTRPRPGPRSPPPSAGSR